MTVSLALSGPDQQWAPGVARAAALARRVLRLDDAALVRVRNRAGERPVAEFFYSTPLGCIIAVRLPGASVGPSDDGATVTAKECLAGLEADPRAGIGQRLDLLWAGALPPQQGYTELDSVPGDALRSLHQAFRAEAGRASGPAGLPPSLLDQALLEVSAASSGQGPAASTARAVLTGRIIAALGAAGLIAVPASDLKKLDYLRVSVSPAWNRVDTIHGSLYAPRPGSLARVP